MWVHVVTNSTFSSDEVPLTLRDSALSPLPCMLTAVSSTWGIFHADIFLSVLNITHQHIFHKYFFPFQSQKENLEHFPVYKLIPYCRGTVLLQGKFP